MNCAEAKKTDKRNCDQAYEAHGALIHTIGKAAPYQGFNRLTHRPRLDPERRKHFINLFIRPTTPEDSTAQTMVEREGDHLVHWSDGDFTYWAVSGVNINDLQSFKQLFEQQTARH
jgi:hypothetical protein